MTPKLLSVGAWAPFDHIFKMSHYPQEGETLLLDMPIERMETVYFGDCALNVAAAAASLGVNSAAATVVGEDFAELRYLAHLQKLGVDTRGVMMLPGEKSGHNHLYFDAAGDGFCFSHLGAAEKQEDHPVPEEVLAGATHVVASERFSGYTLDALRRAKAGGAETFINGMVDTAGPLLQDFLRAADVLFINGSEYGRLLERLGGAGDILFREYGLRLVFCTRGRKGCDIFAPEGAQSVGIARADRRADTTGAGDAFCAGTIAALMKGYPPAVAAGVGSTVSSFVIEEWGCQTGLPGWAQVCGRYAQNYEEAL